MAWLGVRAKALGFVTYLPSSILEPLDCNSLTPLN